MKQWFADLEMVTQFLIIIAALLFVMLVFVGCYHLLQPTFFPARPLPTWIVRLVGWLP
jgi:hypothetical protein